MYTPVNRKFMKDMDKTTLLKMREEQDMTNKDIAHAVGCSEVTIRNIIGAMPPEMRRRKFSENGKRNAINRSRAEGGYTMERKLQSFKPFVPQREEPEPAKAVLTVKRRDIQLAGAYMHYTVSASGSCVDVETGQGQVLISVPNDKLDAFIEELTAIRHHLGDVKPMEFWG